MNSKPQNANVADTWSGLRVRVLCPICDAGGAQYLSGKQPYCHECEERVLMEPADNTDIVCTWDELQEYLNEKIES